MADENTLAILRQGVEAWNQWRETLSSEKIDLSKADLRGADLSEANLSDADLREVDLRGADLSEANLSDADLSEADLRGANLRGAILNRAILSEANLSDADLSDADLSDAELYRANLRGAILNRAILSEAGLSDADLSDAELSGADLYRANLAEAILSGAILSGAILNEAILTGQNLCEADLSGADLSEANLSWANLNEANLSWANLSWANLSWADLRGTNLNRANLSGANLNGKDLSEANLSWANLNEANLSWANLRGADLRGAVLSQLKAIATNFTSANLTGACIEDWHINSETNLTDVICEHVYLRQQQQERRPSDPTVNFAAGDFVTLVQKSLETVDLIFADGIDWTAFLSSFNELKAKYGEDNLAVQAIEKKTGGSFVIRLEVPPEANKAEIERQAKELYENNLKLLETRYHKELQGKDEQIAIYREHYADLKNIIKGLEQIQLAQAQAQAQALPQKGVTINVTAESESKSVSESSSSNRNITTGDITASEGGIVNLGELSGTVRTTINKLPSSPEPGKPGIKELLEQLKTIVESENRLSNQDKAEALEFIQTIAEAGQNPQDSGVQKIVKAPIRALKGILSSLPDVAKLAEAANTLIPLIAKMFGLP